MSIDFDNDSQLVGTVHAGDVGRVRVFENEGVLGIAVDLTPAAAEQGIAFKINELDFGTVEIR